MAEMRRNIAHRRQVVGSCHNSPRTVLVIFFATCTITYVAIIGWQIIIESNNVYLETGAALLTVLLIVGVSICFFRRYRAYRRGINELRQAHPHSSPESEDQVITQFRLYLRQIYGSSVDVDALLANSGGLSVEMIDALVQNYSYSSEGKGILVNVKDVELGITRTNTVNSASGKITTCCEEGSQDVNVEDEIDVSACDGHGAFVSGVSMEFPAFPMECSVCLTNYAEGDVLSELPCRHTYHRACVTEWLRLQNACPMCKQAVFVLPSLSVVNPPANVTSPDLNNSSQNYPTADSNTDILDCPEEASVEPITPERLLTSPDVMPRSASPTSAFLWMLPPGLRPSSPLPLPAPSLSLFNNDAAAPELLSPEVLDLEEG